MYVLKADNRSAEVKVKNLRKEGIVPGCVYGGKLEETLLVQISNKEVIKLLREKTVGGQVSLEVGSKKIIGLLKEVSISPIGNKIEHLSFQSLVAGEPVHSTAQVVLLNAEKVSDVVRQSLFEISIKALPSHLVEEVRIDLEGLSAGAVIRLEDLDIASNQDVELLTATDTMVVSIVEKSAIKDLEPSEEEEEGAETTEEEAETAEKAEE
jgi:large subunit ribosomal protein L25